MKGFIFLFVNLAVSSVLSRNPKDIEIVDIGEDKDIPQANKDLPHGDILQSPNTQRSAINAEDYLWKSPVPYVLKEDLEMNAKGVILRAFDQFRLKSCIDFKVRDDEKYFISVEKKDGCYSYVGRVQAYGQILSIGRFCDDISTVEHEVLHGLGFFHEHSRYDRDDYVTIQYQNIEAGMEINFWEISKNYSTTMGVPYDYMSVMHYGKDAFTNGNGSTIITNDPKYQDVIGQRLDLSPSDALELNLLYKCDSTIAFRMYCGFSNKDMCHMKRCSRGSGSGWEMVTQVNAGPQTDHTNLPNGSGDQGQEAGYFMHASTAAGHEGDAAWLETHRMSPQRECHVQCLQFYYYHSGNQFDHLNIWIREFQDESDLTGTLRLMGQITGPQTSYWQLHHVSLNAIKDFQVEFEVRKGAGSSSGGFSIDDINLSELECPHVTMQIDNFEKIWDTVSYGTILYTKPYYSREGYAHVFGIKFYGTSFGLFMQFVSGKYDDQLEWPCPQRQVTFQFLDQNPNIQLQMSKQRAITSDLSTSSSGSNSQWDNPRKIGTAYVDDNFEIVYAGPLLGKRYFARGEEMKTRDFLKGGTAIFVFNFQDLTPLVNGSALPCPQVGPAKITHLPRDLHQGPCSSWIPTTTKPPPPTTTEDNRIPTTTQPPLPKTTDDNSVFGFSAGLVCSPFLTLLLALMLLIH